MRRTWIILPGILLALGAAGCRRGGTAAAAPTLTPAPSQIVGPESLIGEDAGLKEPRGIAVDGKGRIYIGDTGNGRIFAVEPSGAAVRWPGPKQEANQVLFQLIADLAVAPDGTLATVDAGAREIRVFDRDGKPLLRIPDMISSASGIAVGPDGRLWVADTANSRIRRFTSAGKPDGIFTGEGGSFPRFEQPTDVALAPDGTPYAVDLRGRIMRLDPDGRILSQWTIEWSGAPRGGPHLAFWRGLVVATDPERGRLQVLDPATGAVRFVGEAGNGPGQFLVPVGITAGPDGKLYAVDSGNSRVQVFSRLPEAPR